MSASFRPPPGFAWKAGDTSHEVQTMAYVCARLQIPHRGFRRASQVPPGWVPLGSVSWVEQVLGRHNTPDYFPAFARTHLHRFICRVDEWPRDRVHVKPADRYKRYPGHIKAAGGRGTRPGPHWASDVVTIINEWRYYIASGTVLAAHWYEGVPGSVESPPPPLPFTVPSTWCGTLDMGLLDNGNIALIEAHHPYACGWYGTIGSGETYLSWLTSGWAYLQALRVPPPAPPVAIIPQR
jgi:hypothetical protein